MSINVEEIVTEKINSIVKGSMLSKTEVYDRNMIRDLVTKYGNEDKIEYEEGKVSISEYKEGIKYLVIEGKTKDEGLNLTDCEEHIVIKNDTNVVGYSKATTYVSYLHFINSKLNNDSMIAGQHKIIRNRYNLYIGGKKRVFLESFKEDGFDRVIYERFYTFEEPTNTKRIDLYYNALDVPIYGEIIGSDKDSVKSSKNQTIIKEMIDLAYLGIGDCLDTKVENEYVYKKK